MSDTEKEGKRVKLPHLLVNTGLGILIFLLLVGGTALLLRPLQLKVQDGLEKTKDNFISRAEEYLGLRLKYGSMGPSVFGILDIRDVELLRPDDSVLLSVSRLRLSYSLLKILGGKIPDAFRSVRVDKPVLNLDLDRDAAFIERIKELNRQPPSGAPEAAGLSVVTGPLGLLPENFSLRVLDGSCEFSGAPGTARVMGLRIDASVRQRRISFSGHWDMAASLVSAVYTSSAASFFPFLKNNSIDKVNAALACRINGEYLEDLREGSATLRIPYFQGNFFRARPLTFGLYLSRGNLELRKNYDRMPVAISLNFEAEKGSLGGLLEAENFSPSDLLTFTGPLSNYNSVLGIRLDGRAGFDLSKQGALVYSLDLTGSPGGKPGALNLRAGRGQKPASFSVKAQGNSEGVNIDKLTLVSLYGDLYFSGKIGFLPDELIPVAPDGTLSLSGFNLQESDNPSGNGGISGDFTISSHDRAIHLAGEKLRAGKTVFESLDSSLFRDETGLSFVLTARKQEDSPSLSLEGSADYDSALSRFSHMRARVKLNSFLLGDIVAFADPAGALISLPPFVRSASDHTSVDTEVFFTTDFDQLLYNAPAVSVSYKGLTEISGEASVSGTDRIFELNSGKFTWSDGSVDISCLVDHFDPNDINFSVSAAYRSFSYFLEGMILDQKNISIRGSHGLMVNLSYGSNGIYSGYASGELLPVPSGDHFASLSFLVSLYYESSLNWQAKIEKFVISGLATPSSASAFISFSGEAGEKGMSIPNIHIDDGVGILEGGLNLSWDTVFKYLSFQLDLAGAGRNERYTLTGVYRNDGLELYFTGRNMQLSRISRQNAVLNGNLRLSWESVSSFNAELNLESLVLNLDENQMKAQASVSVNSDAFKIEQLLLNYAGLNVKVPLLSIDRKNANARALALMQGGFTGVQLDLSLRLEALFNNSETWLDLYTGFSSINGSVTVDTARYNTIEADEPFIFDVGFARKEAAVSLNVSGGPRNMLRLNYNSGAGEGGLFFAALSAPSPVRGSFSGIINSGGIDGQLADLYVDLGALWRFMPPSADAVMFPHGFVTGSIRIKGPLDDPQFFGIAYGRSIQIVIPQFLPEPIRPVPATFTFTGSEFTFGPIDAAVGRGGGRASGWFRWEQWIPSTFTINIQVPQETPIPYGCDISGLMAHGQASGRMVVAMEDWILSITGDLVAHNTEISVNVNEMNAFNNEMLLNKDSIVTTVTDINIISGKRVEFFWPSVEFPVLQANADMGTGIKIRSDDGIGSFAVVGNVRLRSGEIFYLERNFYLREGTLFLDINEHEMDPRISARAEIRDQSIDGPVTIAMIIDNAPLMSFVPRFESNPPLSQLEIFSLLGQNPPGDYEAGQRNVLLSGVDFLAQSILFRRFQRQVRDLLGLDMFSMRTTVFQNLILQVPGASTQYNTERSNRVGNYFDNSAVFIGKYFGADIFGEALLSFKYDENKPSFGGMKLEPELALEMRNPLFDIRLNFSPLHPENWFINDLSLSLVWRRTF